MAVSVMLKRFTAFRKWWWLNLLMTYVVCPDRRALTRARGAANAWKNGTQSRRRTCNARSVCIGWATELDATYFVWLFDFIFYCFILGDPA